MPCGALGLTDDVDERMLAAGRGRLRGHGRRGRDAGRQRAVARRDARDARLGPHGRRLGTHHRAGVTVRRRGARGRARDKPWNVTQLGSRSEYRFQTEPARNGTEAHAAWDPDLERYLHLHALNRGVLITPFHNMALMAPTTTEADVDRHTEVFAEAVSSLAS